MASQLPVRLLVEILHPQVSDTAGGRTVVSGQNDADTSYFRWRFLCRVPRCGRILMTAQLFTAGNWRTGK